MLFYLLDNLFTQGIYISIIMMATVHFYLIAEPGPFPSKDKRK